VHGLEECKKKTPQHGCGVQFKKLIKIIIGYCEAALLVNSLC